MERKAEQIPESPDPMAEHCLRLDDNLSQTFLDKASSVNRISRFLSGW